MKNVITQLKRILIIDNEIDELTELRENIPQQIADLREELGKIEKEGEFKKIALENYLKDESEKKLILIEEKERFSKSEEKLKEVTNNKEFAALQKEISVAKKNSEALQSDLESLANKIAEEKPNFEAWQQSVNDLKTDLESKIAALQDTAAGLASQIETKVKARANEESIIGPEVLKKYQTIKKKVSPAMALAENGTCSECHTRIPPQMYIEIQKMNSILTCPRCYRILHVDYAD